MRGRGKSTGYRKKILSEYLPGPQVKTSTTPGMASSLLILSPSAAERIRKKAQKEYPFTCHVC